MKVMGQRLTPIARRLEIIPPSPLSLEKGEATRIAPTDNTRRNDISATQPKRHHMCCRAGASPASGTVASPFAKGEGEGEGCFNPVETRC
jgi:hypothetical protein